MVHTLFLLQRMMPFAALLTAIGQTSVDDVPESVLRTILEYHVISTAAIMSGDLSDGQTAEALSGEDDHG